MAGSMILDRLFDRREFPRRTIAEHHAKVTGRVRPGREVRLIDVSRGGALVHAAARLMPGSQVEVHMSIGPWQWSGSAQVVRCHVWALAFEEQVRYRAAFQFTHPMDPANHDAFEIALEGAAAAAEHGNQVPATGSLDPW